MYSEIFETLYPINMPKKERGVVVTGVEPFALGEEVGIQTGDRIIKVNGFDIRDFIDWQFYTGAEDQVRVEFIKTTGEMVEVDVEVGEGETWGLDFEYFAPRQCANDCLFCFCNQNPAGARESLFFKDEDTRLSFLHGNYTTMSSISKLELDRIITQRLSPQYVSVHATDAEVRKHLLGRKRTDDVLGKMKYLAERGIELHAQIVLCPTINDGDVLRRTINDLAELHPALTSIAIVPVVVTKLHNYRHLLTPVTDEYARSLIKEMRPRQREFRHRLGNTFVFLADEFYLRAGLPLPGRSHYGDYPQIEDGIGMVRRFVAESKNTMKRQLARKMKLNGLRGTVATGSLFYPVLAPFIEEVNESFGARLKTVSVESEFFGEEVTVAGLLAGGDFIKARERFEGDFVIVPEQACLKSGHIFLDDLTLEGLEEKLGCPVAHGGASLQSMIKAAVELQSRAGRKVAATGASFPV